MKEKLIQEIVVMLGQVTSERYLRYIHTLLLTFTKEGDKS